VSPLWATQIKGFTLGIVAGIDEAGLGPILGPLVVTGTVFRVPDACLSSCLWDTLAKTLARTPQRSGRRIAIMDSKRLFAGRKTLAPLERPALVMLAAAGRGTTSWHQFLGAVSPRTTGLLESYPWYAGPDFELPLADQTGDIATRATPVRRDLTQQHTRLERVICEVVLEKDYNRLVGSTRNKSVALMGVALRIVDCVFRLAGDEPVRIVVDRLGGRMRYRQPLAHAFPEYDIRIAEESKVRSAYELRAASRLRWIEFRTNGEDHALPTALAGIYSKYVRELFMHAFNRYWSSRVPGVRPTAGYYTDAIRFLKDIGPTLDRMPIDRAILVRVK